MESNIDTKAEAKTVAQAEQHPPEVIAEPGGTMTTLTKEPAKSDRPWQEYLEPVAEFLKAPDYVIDFASEYRKPLTYLALFISSIIAVKITLAVISSINDVPLLAPLFELIGIGYSGWFVYRYLLRASTRQELKSEFSSLKSQVAGENARDL